MSNDFTSSSSERGQMSSVLQEGDPIRTGNWTNGLFGCFDNMGLCALTFIAPCVTFGRMANMHGDDCASFGVMYLIPGLNCYLESNYRQRIRKRRGIMDSRLMDFLIILFCPPCALTQEANETYIIQAEELRLGAIMGGAPAGAFAHTRTGQSITHPGFPTGGDNPKFSPDVKPIPNSAPATIEIPNPIRKLPNDPFHAPSTEETIVTSLSPESINTDSDCALEIARS